MPLSDHVFAARSTNNKLSAEGRAHLKLAFERLSRLPYYNVPAHALMHVAHDLHFRGSPDDNLLAEHILAGVARGLGAQIEGDEKHPVCPGCGKRHAPAKDLLALVKALRAMFK